MFSYHISSLCDYSDSELCQNIVASSVETPTIGDQDFQKSLIEQAMATKKEDNQCNAPHCGSSTPCLREVVHVGLVSDLRHRFPCPGRYGFDHEILAHCCKA